MVLGIVCALPAVEPVPPPLRADVIIVGLFTFMFTGWFGTGRRVAER